MSRSQLISVLQPLRPLPAALIVVPAFKCTVQLVADHDATRLPMFSAVFSLRRRLVLDRLYIGELDVAPGEEMEVVEYEDDLAEGQFYQVLKRRVEKYFRGNEVLAGDHSCCAAVFPCKRSQAPHASMKAAIAHTTSSNCLH